MKQFFLTLPRNVLGCFLGRRWLWHLFFIALTFGCVTSGFDWWYFSATRNPLLREWMFPSAPIGGLVPITLPLLLILPATSPAMRASPQPAGRWVRRRSSGRCCLPLTRRSRGECIRNILRGQISATISGSAGCAAASSGVGRHRTRPSRLRWR